MSWEIMEPKLKEIEADMTSKTPRAKKSRSSDKSALSAVIYPPSPIPLGLRLKMMKTFWNSSQNSHCFFDRDLRLIDLNTIALKRLKTKKLSAIGRHILELFPYLEGSERYQKYEEVVRTGKPFSIKEVPYPHNPSRRISIYAFRINGGMGLIASDESLSCRVKSELKTTIERLENLSAHNLALREEESRRIAREIHDEMSPTLTTLKMDLYWLLAKAGDGVPPPPAFHKRIAEMTNLIDISIASIRKVCSELRPALLDDLGLFDAIEWQVQESQKRYPLRCRLDIDCNGTKFDPDLSLCIFRIFQEGYTNILRHAQATKASVSLRHIPSENAVVLKIRDNGRGIRPEEVADPKSFGLIGMRERLRPYQGRMSLRGTPGKGTTLAISIPAPAKSNPNGQR